MAEKKTAAETVRGIMQGTNAEGRAYLIGFINVLADYNLRHDIGAADVIYNAYTEIINELPADDIKKICLFATETAQTPKYQKGVIFLRDYKKQEV